MGLRVNSPLIFQPRFSMFWSDVEGRQANHSRHTKGVVLDNLRGSLPGDLVSEFYYGSSHPMSVKQEDFCITLCFLENMCRLQSFRKVRKNSLDGAQPFVVRIFLGFTTAET